MRFKNLYIVLLSIPAAILGNTHHVPDDYPLLQSAIDATGSGDTIICDTVKDFDTISIINKTDLVVMGASTTNLTTIARVVLVESSTCVLSMLSFVGAKGLDGTNNFSCKSAPGLDGRDGGDAIIIDSSTVTIAGCSAKGGDGGTYGISYQGTMLCICGAKGTPGTALKANSSKISLINDSLLSGYCAGTSIAGCFTNNCAEQGLGCAGSKGSVIDTIHTRINSASLDSTSVMEPMVTKIKGAYALSPALGGHRNFASVSGLLTIPDDCRTPFEIHIYNAEGKLVWRRSHVVTKQLDLRGKLPQNIYIITLQYAENRITGRLLSIRSR